MPFQLELIFIGDVLKEATSAGSEMAALRFGAVAPELVCQSLKLLFLFFLHRLHVLLEWW